VSNATKLFGRNAHQELAEVAARDADLGDHGVSTVFCKPLDQFVAVGKQLGVFDIGLPKGRIGTQRICHL
jgi:hypothetical protein